VSAGEEIICTFTNTKRATIVVTKYNDRNQNGLQDDEEESLSDWEISLNDTKQMTGQDGTTTFNNILPGEEYAVDETMQDGWEFSGISCTGDPTGVAVSSRETAADASFIPAAGETVTCKLSNF